MARPACRSILFRSLACLAVAAALGLSAGAEIAAAGTSGAQAVAVAPDGLHVYGGTSGTSFSVFSRDTNSLLTPIGVSPFVTPGGCGLCRGIAVSPDGKFVYASANPDQLLQYAVNGGEVQLVATYPNHSGGITGMTAPLGIALSPDGSSLYVVGENGTITAFSRDSGTGGLSFVGTYNLEANASREAVVTPDGNFVYVAVPNGNGRIETFSRNTGTGALSGHATLETGCCPTNLAVSPNGKFLYVGGEERLRVYERNLLTGAVLNIQEFVNGSGGLEGFKAERSMAIPSDGEDLYAVSPFEDALISFQLDSTTGEATYISTIYDGEGIDGLGGAALITASGDGAALYVAAPEDNGIGVFTRANHAAAPQFVQLATDGLVSPPPGGGGGGPTETPNGLLFNGHESVSIDNGALYTNSPAVSLRIRPPANTSKILISNDGGFEAPASESVAPSGRYAWKLASSGPERLPKTVYVRFAGPGGPSALTFTDDIILDETPPKIAEATATPAPQSSSARPSGGRGLPLELTVKASDRTSGVGALQVTNDRKKPGPFLKYRLHTRFLSHSKRVFVRVRDRAKNLTHWRLVEVAGPAGSSR